jgi:tRNA wybutosine-synthesizing protein 3
MNEKNIDSDFLQAKQTILNNLAKGIDKSKKGSIDTRVKPIIELLNKHENYVTTSSCSGRIMLISTKSLKYKKKECIWLFSTHNLILNIQQISQIKTIISEQSNSTNTLFLKVEPAIFHVLCKDISSAINLLNICKKVGFKHSGIFSITKHKIILEIERKESFNFPILNNAKILINTCELPEIIEICNSKLNSNFEHLSSLEKNLQNL